MIRFRTFRNSDPPSLAKLWNLGIPGTGMARPLRVHELDAHSFGTVCFDPRGLIIAESDGVIVGFAHAGFGPDDPDTDPRPFRLNRSIGTIAMMLIDPNTANPEIGRELVIQAETYLKNQGARVIYLGGQSPLNPFYWGTYGGSEFSGYLSGFVAAHRLARELGYESVSTTVVLEVDLEQPLARDPRAVILRRQSQISFEEDELPSNWWENLALGDFHMTRVRLNSKSDSEEIARAVMWDMSWFSRLDGLARIGIINFEVAAGYRRNGYGRFLMSEILRTAREQMFAVAQVQTNAANQAALALYHATGFQPIDEATLYRLPADRMDRSV